MQSSGWMQGMILGSVLFGAVVLVGFFWAVWSLRGRKSLSGAEGLLGARGRVKALTPEGALVHVQGEDWLATWESSPLAVGQTIEVLGVEGLRLNVRALGVPKPEIQEKRGGKA